MLVDGVSILRLDGEIEGELVVVRRRVRGHNLDMTVFLRTYLKIHRAGKPRPYRTSDDAILNTHHEKFCRGSACAPAIEISPHLSNGEFSDNL
jgi:hypothetical protein